MEKGSTKSLGIVFVIVLIILLAAHLMAMRSAKAEFTKKEQATAQQIVELNKKIEALSMDKMGLEIKSKLNGIRMQVAENNFGSAGESLNAFKEYLNKNGCKKMDQLAPVFDGIDTNLSKKKNAEVKQALDQVEDIIFGTGEATEKEKTEEAGK